MSIITCTLCGEMLVGDSEEDAQMMLIRHMHKFHAARVEEELMKDKVDGKNQPGTSHDQPGAVGADAGGLFGARTRGRADGWSSRAGVTVRSTPTREGHVCAQCTPPQTFFSNNKLVQHLRKEHGSNVQPSVHNRKGRKGVYPPGFYGKIDGRPVRPFPCPVNGCPEAYTLKQSLGVHIRKAHPIFDARLQDQPKSGDHKCYLCGYFTSILAELDGHNSTVHGIAT